MRYFLLLSLLLPFWITAQSYPRHDAVWVLSRSYLPDTTAVTGSRIDFNSGSAVVSSEVHAFNFHLNNSSICDADGKLLFYTNGVQIANPQHQILAGSHGFNNDPVTQAFLELGLPVTQATLFLPAPGSDHLYYLLHEELTYLDTFGLNFPHLYYTLIDQQLEQGNGAVLQKNQKIISDTLDDGRIAAVRHANGRDWWVLVVERHSNKFYRILIDPNGPRLDGVQIIGDSTKSDVGQATFSPDGKHYARVRLTATAKKSYLGIFQFDRCTGLLSNPIEEQCYNCAHSQGLAFSPNSRFLYTSWFTLIRQYDLQASNILASVDTIAIYDGVESPPGQHTRFQQASLAPDGKIYISSSTTTDILHVIHRPDEKGDACMWEPRGLSLPVLNIGSLPTFPNFRLGPVEGSACDSIISVSAQPHSPAELLKAKLFPNPADGSLQLQLSEAAGEPLTFTLYDQLGRPVLQHSLAPGSRQAQFNTASLSQGVYIASLKRENQAVFRQKLIILH